VGFGRIGQAVAKRARGFDMRVIYYDPYVEESPEGLEAEPADLGKLLSTSDFVSVHVPLTDATHHLLSGEELAQMKPTAVLINTARGPVVDPDALLQALEEDQLAAAALDVTEPEPIPDDHPLLALPNCIVTPHIASGSVATRGKMATMAADNLLAGLRGERLPNCVNPGVYSDKS
jgi:phosphoglycerate dehydrogenase-like enzyme